MDDPKVICPKCRQVNCGWWGNGKIIRRCEVVIRNGRTYAPWPAEAPEHADAPIIVERQEHP